jgi:hypothetical protein
MISRIADPMHARRQARRATLALGVVGALLTGACGSLLDVENPNNVNADALKVPASAAAQANGTLAALTRGAVQLVGHAEIASDNFIWSGSLDGVDRLSRGEVRDPYNEFLEDAFNGMTPARFMAARTIKQLEEFKAAGTLADPTQLALANLYGAITYDYLANHFDNFVIASSQREAGDAVGPDKMVTLYDSAEAAATRALTSVPAANTLLKGQVLAVRARAKFDRAIWRKLNPSGKTPAQPLVDDQGAADDAIAALPLLGSDYRYKLEVQTGMGWGNCFLPSCTNSRREIIFNPALATYNYTTKVMTVALKDPITGQPDPAVGQLLTEFVNGLTMSPLTVTGSRDMLLIAAEVALAKGNTTEFASRINQIRALNALPSWTGAAGQPTALEILIHERRANTVMQGRRLNDMYRFGIVSPAWGATSEARVCPGSLFPITNGERLSNPKVASVQPACGQ